MTQIAEKRIISEISDLKNELKEIKQFFIYLIANEDSWLYDPDVKKYLQARFKQAEKEYKKGKIKPINKLWQQLGV